MNEIFVLYSQSTSANIYCLIRKASDLTVYEPSTGTFVTWVDANIDDYDIPLTYQSSDIYAVDHPAVAVDSYIISIYLQAGATPSLTLDTRLDGYNYSWDGANIVPVSGSVVLDTYSLITLNDAKTYMGISLTDTTQDDRIKDIINQMSAHLERVIDRKIKARDYSETRRATRGCINTKQYPIISINRVAIDTNNAFSLSENSSFADIICYCDGNNFVVKAINATTGTTTTYTYLLTSYPIVSLLVAQINTDISGITASVVNNIPTTYLCPMAGTSFNDKIIQIQYFYDSWLNYIIRNENGLINFVDGHYYNQWVQILYRAGYDSVPYDLKNAVLEAINNVYQMVINGIVTGITKQQIGDYSYTIGAVGSQDIAINTSLYRFNSDIISFWRKKSIY